jgi:hypothetical protein
VSLKLVVAEVATCAKFEQPEPWQRSIRYWLIVPPVSVAAVQERLICVLPAAVAVRADGAVKVTALTTVNALLLVAVPPGVVTLKGPVVAPVGTVA